MNHMRMRLEVSYNIYERWAKMDAYATIYGILFKIAQITLNESCTGLGVKNMASQHSTGLVVFSRIIVDGVTGSMRV